MPTNPRSGTTFSSRSIGHGHTIGYYRPGVARDLLTDGRLNRQQVGVEWDPKVDGDHGEDASVQ